MRKAVVYCTTGHVYFITTCFLTGYQKCLQKVIKLYCWDILKISVGFMPVAVLHTTKLLVFKGNSQVEISARPSVWNLTIDSFLFWLSCISFCYMLIYVLLLFLKLMGHKERIIIHRSFYVYNYYLAAYLVSYILNAILIINWRHY